MPTLLELSNETKYKAVRKVPRKLVRSIEDMVNSTTAAIRSAAGVGTYEERVKKNVIQARKEVGNWGDFLGRAGTPLEQQDTNMFQDMIKKATTSADKIAKSARKDFERYKSNLSDAYVKDLNKSMAAYDKQLATMKVEKQAKKVADRTKSVRKNYDDNQKIVKNFEGTEANKALFGALSNTKLSHKIRKALQKQVKSAKGKDAEKLLLGMAAAVRANPSSFSKTDLDILEIALENGTGKIWVEAYNKNGTEVKGFYRKRAKKNKG